MSLVLDCPRDAPPHSSFLSQYSLSLHLVPPIPISPPLQSSPHPYPSLSTQDVYSIFSVRLKCPPPSPNLPCYLASLGLRVAAWVSFTSWLILCISECTPCVPFWVCVISLRTIFSSSIHLSANFMMSLLLIAESYSIMQMYHIFFIHSSVVG